MSFKENPLSLSLPQSALEASLQERGLLDSSVLERAHLAGQGSVFALWQAVCFNPFSVLTVEDLARPPASWTGEFWDCGNGPADSYSWPHSGSQVQLRMRENLKKYSGNYLVLLLVIFLILLYNIPIAILGLLAIVGVLDGIRMCAASWGLTGGSKRMMALSFIGQATAWVLLVYTKIGHVVFWTGLLGFVVFVLHASTRRLTSSLKD